MKTPRTGRLIYQGLSKRGLSLKEGLWLLCGIFGGATSLAFLLHHLMGGR